MGGKRVEVDVAAEAEDQDTAAIETRLGVLVAEIDDVLRDACAELPELYNGSWADHSGFSATPAAMKKKIRLTTISLDHARWTLYCADATLFGGHTIEVWSGKRGTETSLLG